MKPRSPRLLEIDSAFPGANVMLRLLEPHGSCHDVLRERVYSGSYDKPFVVDNGPRRFLHFDFAAIQSAMELNNPERLALAYTRKMMAFLLFNRTPERILMLGLGGGSLAKFCYANLPVASLTAVEVNKDVIALREEFCIPADDHRFRVINADAAGYVSALAHLKDVILADACDRFGMAAELDSVEFYRKARHNLSADGVFVTNLCGDKVSTGAHLAKLRDAFDDEVLSLQVRKDGNIIAFGFKDRRPESHWDRIEAGAADLRRRFRLDFPLYARRIAVDSKLREAQTADRARPPDSRC
ncbi:MAG: spermidine synthase-like protein [Pseudomonadota bacterium]